VHQHQAPNNIAIAFYLNLSFTLIEIIGGFYTNSIAIQSDALHDIGDSVSLGLAWYFQKLSSKSENNLFTYGYKRFNTLGAVITGVILASGSVYIFMESIPRFFTPEPVESGGMIGLAILGVVVNSAAVWRLKKGGHSLNEKMLFWHLMEDVLGWVAVLVGSLIMYLYQIYWIDPLLSVLITVYILYNVIKNLKKAILIMLEATPDNVRVKNVSELIETFEEVKRAYHIHVWTLDGENHLLTAHVVVNKHKTMEEIKPLRLSITNKLEEDLGLGHVTLEFEMED
jgi:cobalt-zinc-cadmium efflux system protein